MRRTVLLLTGTLFGIVPLFGSDSPKEYDDKTEYVGIEGTWRVTECESNGEKSKPQPQQVLTCRGAIITLNYSNGHTSQWNYRIDATHNPPHLDIIRSNGPLQGQTVKCIYHIDGDTLRIADLGVERPQGFNDKGVVISIYKRVK